MIRKNIKLLIGFVIGLAITTGTVYAVNSLNAREITIDKTNGKLAKINGDKLNNALDYLYSQSQKTNMITIESGVKHLSQTYLGIAYLDPTNLDNKCTSANSVSTTGTKTGCMKWYIYDEYYNTEDSKWYYKMILDHNTTASQAWNTTTDEEHPYGINVAFAANTIGDSKYDNLAYNELMKLVSDYDWKVIPDLISADEVAKIVEYSGFNSGTSSWFCFDTKQPDASNWCSKVQGTSNFPWLYDNLGWNDANLGWTDWDCTSYGCNIWDGANSAAYWTKTPYGTAGFGSHIWHVNGGGYLYWNDTNYSYIGLRPVITIPKNQFN